MSLTSVEFPLYAPKYLYGKVHTQTDGDGRKQRCDYGKFYTCPTHQPKNTEDGKNQGNTANQAGHQTSENQRY
jgi:hypothetical protein